jgi:endonuclease YncB( thermonuclease family)
MPYLKYVASLCGLLCLLPAWVTHANELQGKVIRVADGDTLTILIEPIKLDVPIRLSGIDAPEKGMPFGQASKKSLSDLAFGKQAVVAWDKKDKYGRLVGKVFIDGQDINIEQLHRGLAWHFKEYENEQPPEDRITYSQAEDKARASKTGLWNDKEPTPPWTWRKARRAAGNQVVVEEALVPGTSP